MELFEIIDGVRRAKAFELLGKTKIPAEICDSDGNLIGKRDIDIESLRVTTKQSIDVSTTVGWERFMKTFNQTRTGSVPPPILVTPGRDGMEIRDVFLNPNKED